MKTLFRLLRLYENDEIVIVDKPAGWLSVPSRDLKDSRAIVGIKLQEELGQRLFPVHRLDYEVSGILIFAKNSRAQGEWQNLFQERKIKKIYYGLSHLPQPFVLPENLRHLYREPPLEKETIWECFLEKGKRRAFESPRGKIAQTVSLARVLDLKTDEPLLKSRWSWVLELEQVLFWSLSPLTGRSHQLRYEMFRHGCPLLGDSLYGSTFPQENQIALCHAEIHLEKPMSGIQKLTLKDLL